jgi:acetyl/propionyl-CoA carboxylase alpha subunit
MRTIDVTLDGVTYVVQIRPDPADHTRFTATINGEEIPIYVPDPSDPGMLEWMVVNDRPYEILLNEDLEWLLSSGGMHQLDVRWRDRAGGPAARPSSGDGRIKAPIPGLIARVLVEPGAEVESGAPVLVLEAMKMENEIRAPRAGKVQTISTKPGASVKLGELLMEIG